MKQGAVSRASPWDAERGSQPARAHTHTHHAHASILSEYRFVKEATSKIKLLTQS